ncbi:MAG: membrane protein insertion efficiency factor YidD [Proteobacteria bacterium]|nr:membrane protein insertion efficiency factor YidD [Pseudomonadota bacterium]
MVKFILTNIIRFYQIAISPLLGKGKCCYYPSCSSYAIQAIKSKGVVKGLFMTLCRILKCHPWSSGGYDPVDKIK